MRDYKPIITTLELKANYESGERDFSHHDFDGAVFENLNLEGVNFESSWLHSATFINCNLRKVNFNHCTAKCIEFLNTDLRGATFYESTIDGTYFDKCDLRDCNFDNASWYGGAVTTTRLFELNKERNKTE